MNAADAQMAAKLKLKSVPQDKPGKARPEKVPESAQEFLLQQAAREMVEIARFARGETAVELITDSLRQLVKAKPHIKVRSGFMAKHADQVAGECMNCGDERRLYHRPNQVLWCAECVLDDILATLNITSVAK